MSEPLFKRAFLMYREDGFLNLLKACIKFSLYVVQNLPFSFYQLRGKRTFSIGDMKITMFVANHIDARELSYVYVTEHFVRDDILRELRPNDEFWDIGANLGFYSLLAANCPGVKVSAFEPNPITVKRLRKNVELNNKSNIKVIQVALSNTEGRARFDPIEIDSTNGKAHLAFNETRGSIEVETSSGDKLIENSFVARPDIVKIDVEGAEHLVINGMRSALHSCRVIFCEAHASIEKYGSSAEDLELDLKNMGFNIEKVRLKNRENEYHLIARSLFTK